MMAARPPLVARKTAALVLAAVTIQLVMVIAFTWPAARTAPHDVPLVVAGAQAETVADGLARQRPGLFDIERVADEQAARQALLDREAYGAIVTTPAGPRMLVASGASPVVAQQLSQLGGELSLRLARVSVPAPQDVAPAGPHGAAFGALVLPLIMSSVAAAILLTLLVPTMGARLAGLAGFAILGGPAVAALAQGWLDVLPSGSYLAVSGVMALAILACSGLVAGLAALFGPRGIGGGALTLILVGNPLSAAAAAPELLPEPWGALGQLLPPGAAVTALRSVAYFDGAALTGPLLVLLAWTAVAAAMLGGAWLRHRGAPAAVSHGHEPALVG